MAGSSLDKFGAKVLTDCLPRTKIRTFDFDCASQYLLVMESTLTLVDSFIHTDGDLMVAEILPFTKIVSVEGRDKSYWFPVRSILTQL